MTHYSCYYLNRTICDVLNEMRKCCETSNYSYLPSLIEEAQSMANRMEAGLHNVSDLETISQDLADARKELKKVQLNIQEQKDKKQNKQEEKQ